MKVFIVTLLLISSFGISKAQKNPLEVFKPFIGKTWKASGKWGDGSKFIQEATYTRSLEGNLVIVDSKGFVDKNQKILGHRNHGIRKFDPSSGTIKFWEFDVFGGVTKGDIKITGKDFYYQYEYEGTLITDMWQYIDENTYKFVVGIYKDEKWENTFLTTEFKAE